MLKMWDETIRRPLHMIYTPCLDYGVFPSLLKMSNLISIHKEESKQRVSNYRPISLLLTCDKIFERIYISCVLILLKMMWIIKVILALINFCRSHMKFNIHFDEGFEVCGVLLDISKTFDKVWHEGLLVKLRRSGISG